MSVFRYEVASGKVMAERVSYDRIVTHAPCEVHDERHRPPSLVNQIHHIWPLGAGGPDTPDNRVVICATGHCNVHNLIREFFVYQGAVPHSVLKLYHHQERDLARLGFRRIQRKVMVPADG